MSLSKTQNAKQTKSSGILTRNHFSAKKIEKRKDESDLRIHETESSFHFRLKLPGYVKEDFNFYVNGNDYLVVTTEKINKKTTLKNTHRHSYCYASAYFKRKFPMPKNVVRDKISVDYEDETLTFELFKPNK